MFMELNSYIFDAEETSGNQTLALIRIQNAEERIRTLAGTKPSGISRPRSLLIDT